MDWAKISTDLLLSGVPDKDILAIVKYQMVWALLEREPTDEQCRRFMTTAQLRRAHDYHSSIERCMIDNIKSCERHRQKQRDFYQKNQQLKKFSDGQTDGQTDVLEERRGDKRREDITPPISPLIEKSPIKEALKKWFAYKRERKQTYTKTGLADCIKQLEKLSNNDPGEAMRIVEQSTSNNWSGLFLLKTQKVQKEDKIPW